MPDQIPVLEVHKIDGYLPSNILSSSFDPEVICMISSLCAWSWLALVNPKGTNFEAVHMQH